MTEFPMGLHRMILHDTTHWITSHTSLVLARTRRADDIMAIRYHIYHVMPWSMIFRMGHSNAIHAQRWLMGVALQLWRRQHP